MPEWGYGSPSSATGAASGTPFDWGYGSKPPAAPWSADEADSGYGEVSVAAIGAYVWDPAGAVISDEGGHIITIRGAFALGGPYHARLVAQDGTLYPLSADCWTVVPGSPADIYTDHTRESLRFVSPPAPAGLYDVRLRFGPGYVLEELIEDAILVERRNRAADTYLLRRLFPPDKLVGPRDLTGEDTIS